MISSALAFALLCLLSVARAAPLDCNLVRPLDEVNAQELEGGWALVAGSVNNSTKLEMFRQRESDSINVTILSDGSIQYARGLRWDGDCINLLYSITLDGGNFTLTGKDRGKLFGQFYRPPCSDCLLMKMDMDSGERTHLYLFSRRREVKEEELGQFRSQIECLNMPPPVLKDPTIDLC